jgi:hypothetical protein
MKKVQWAINAAVGNGPTVQGSGNLEFESCVDTGCDLTEANKSKKIQINLPATGKVVMLGIFADKYDVIQSGKESFVVVKPDKFGHLQAPILLFGNAAAKAIEGLADLEFSLEIKAPPTPVPAAASVAPVPKPPEATRSIQVVIGVDLP